MSSSQENIEFSGNEADLIADKYTSINYQGGQRDEEWVPKFCEELRKAGKRKSADAVEKYFSGEMDARRFGVTSRVRQNQEIRDLLSEAETESNEE